MQKQKLNQHRKSCLTMMYVVILLILINYCTTINANAVYDECNPNNSVATVSFCLADLIELFS
jgi:hypothetical protein